MELSDDSGLRCVSIMTAVTTNEMQPTAIMCGDGPLFEKDPTSDPQFEEQLKSQRKRVEFSSATECIGTEDNSPDRRYQPRPIRSILKPSGFLQDDMMLTESCSFNVVQVKTEEPDYCKLDYSLFEILSIPHYHHQHLDVYIVLANVFKSEDGASKIGKLSPNWKKLTEFLMRDVKCADHCKTTVLLQKRNAAIKLLGLLLWYPEFSNRVDSDTGARILLHCCEQLESENTSKIGITHYLWLLHTQRLPAWHFSQDLVSKLHLAAFSLKEKTVASVAINLEIANVISRILLLGSELIMPHVRSHLQYIVYQFYQNIPVITQRCIILLDEIAAFVTDGPTRLSIFESVLDVSSTPTLSDFVEKNRTFLARVDRGKLVPRIWGAVVSFLGSQIYKWRGMNQWLKLIQHCFNNGKVGINIVSFEEWINLTKAFAAVEPLVNNQKRLKILCAPYFLACKASANCNARFREAVFSGLKELLHICLGAGMTTRGATVLWDEVIDRLLLEFSSTSTPFCQDIFRYLCSLLHPKSEGEVDMCGFDPHWIRAQLKKVIMSMVPFLSSISGQNKTFWSGEIIQMWKAVMMAVNSAAAREIRTSKVSYDAMHTICEAICDIWSRATMDVKFDLILPMVLDTIIITGHLFKTTGKLTNYPFKPGNLNVLEGPFLEELILQLLVLNTEDNQPFTLSTEDGDELRNRLSHVLLACATSQNTTTPLSLLINMYKFYPDARNLPFWPLIPLQMEHICRDCKLDMQQLVENMAPEMGQWILTDLEHDRDGLGAENKAKTDRQIEIEPKKTEDIDNEWTQEDAQTFRDSESSGSSSNEQAEVQNTRKSNLSRYASKKKPETPPKQPLMQSFQLINMLNQTTPLGKRKYGEQIVYPSPPQPSSSPDSLMKTEKAAHKTFSNMQRNDQKGMITNSVPPLCRQESNEAANRKGLEEQCRLAADNLSHPFQAVLKTVEQSILDGKLHVDELHGLEKSIIQVQVALWQIRDRSKT